MIQHRTVRALLASTFIAAAASAVAMHPDSNPFDAQPGWGELPAGRTWGSTSAIYPGPGRPQHLGR